MLFNSFVFIFAFLPVVLAGFHLLIKKNARAAFVWLIGASLFFYGWWNAYYLLVLGGSVLFNFGYARLIVRYGAGTQKARFALAAGIVSNLALLGYFKYAGFFVETLDAAFDLSWTVGKIILPLAISFFTFQKIAFLVDCYKGAADEPNFINYLLFISFFPQLIAGPIVHYREIMPQFRDVAVNGVRAASMAAGLMLFSIGLFKKTVLADMAAVPSNMIYGAAQDGQALSLMDSWGGAFAYSFQIYFDFSAYSDMAIGLGLMFGVRLPVNFLSPYLATGFVDFWKRWHITLSRFLRDYIYFPLGGNRHGLLSQGRNIMITMALGGLWHGADWTFILWGVAHGIMIVANHALRALPVPVPKLLAIPVTFVLITVLWVLFRAESLGAVHSMLSGMAGLNEAAGFNLLNDKKNYALFALLAVVTFLLPSSMAFLGIDKIDHSTARLQTRPAAYGLIRYDNNAACLCLAVLLFLIACLFMQSNLANDFIYFDF